MGRCVPVVVSAETGQEESWNFLDSSHLKLGTGEDNKATTVLLASIAQGLSLHTDPIQSAARTVSSSWIRQSWSSKVRFTNSLRNRIFLPPCVSGKSLNVVSPNRGYNESRSVTSLFYSCRRRKRPETPSRPMAILSLSRPWRRASAQQGRQVSA